MKAKTLSSLLKLAVACVLISTVSACSDEPPPANTFKKYVSIHPGCVFPIIVCDNDGNECAKRGMQFSFRTEAEYDRFNTFLRLVDHDSASHFFQYYEWEDIFPELESRYEIVRNIIDETYRIKILADSSIVILSGEEINSENIVFAYDYDARVMCDSQ